MRARHAWLACVALSHLFACASAGGGGGDDDDRPDATAGTPDAAQVDPDATLPIDAAPIDAAPQAVTLSQNGNAATVLDGNTPTCGADDGGGLIYTHENRWYRAFRLVDHGVSGPMTVQHIDIGIQLAETTAGSQTVQVKLYTLTGAINLANLTQLYGQNVLVNDMTLAVLPIDLTSSVAVPAGSTLVVEVFAPAHTVEGNWFMMGSNAAGETAPGYILATACGISQPTDIASVNPVPTMPSHIVMSVTGTTP